MIPFFRKIRRQLAHNNQFFKYSRYAIGEIVLVVIGILIALGINNWNINRQKEAQFNLVLDQIYTTLKMDLEMQNWHLKILDTQLLFVDSLINDNSVIPESKLPILLFSLEWLPGPGVTMSNSTSYISQLNYSYGENKKSNLEFQISSYYGMVKDYIEPAMNKLKKKLHITSVLKKYNIPDLPPIHRILTQNIELNYIGYTDSTVVKVQSLLNTEEFNAALISTRIRTIYIKGHTKRRIKKTLSLIKSIKSYNPKTQLKINNIELIGSAMRSYSNSLKPMILIDESKSIWEIICNLEKGNILFTSESTPFSNGWGGKDFPNGKALMFGEKIKVSEGKYKIILNLEESHYQFIKLD